MRRDERAQAAPSGLERKVRTVFVAIVAAFVALAALLYAIGVDYRAAEYRRITTIEIMSALDDTLSALQEAETGERGYIITGKPEYLAPYERARSELDLTLRRLNALFAGDAARIGELATLQRLAHAKLAQIEETIGLRRRDGFAAAQEVMMADLGKRTMDEIRALIMGLDQRKAGELEQFRASAESGARRMALGLAILGLLVTGSVLASYAFIVRDLRVIERLHAALIHDAYHDGITGLPNRTFLMETLRHHLAHARRSGTLLGLLYIDLDAFKQLNDRHGREAGDSVLIETARRLRACLRESDIVARLAADEFAILALGPSGREALAMLAERIRAAMSPRLLPRLADDSVTASVGIALFPGDGHDAEQLVKSADEDMYRARQAAKGVESAREAHTGSSR